MRICLYTETALPKIGGQELVVDALARCFLAMGHQPTVLAQFPRGRTAYPRTGSDEGKSKRPFSLLGRFFNKPDDSTLPYPVIRHPRFVSTRFLIGWYRRWLIEAHKRHRFDVVHCHSVYPCGYLAALCRHELGIPVVITSHGGDVREGNHRFQWPEMPSRYRQAVTKADALIAIGRFTAEAYRRLSSQPLPIVDLPNGVHLSHYQTAVSRPPGLDPRIVPKGYLLFMGRLNRRKGVDVLLQAAAALPVEKRPRLVIAGDGEERGALEASAGRLGLSEHVSFLGHTAGEHKLYLQQNALAAVVCSRDWEAFPLVVLESYAAGVLVIGTRIPGLEDVVHPQRTGLLVAPESPTELAAAMDRVWRDRPWCESMREKILALAAEYDWNRIAERHLDLYQDLRRNLTSRRAG